MLSNEQAEFLLMLPKFLVQNDRKLERLSLNQPAIWRGRHNLIGESDGNIFEFLWEIWQGTRNILKMNLHFQEDETKTGLFRVDYWSGHTNPPTLSDKVPAKFHPYMGKHFSVREHHVHYHVEDYPTLAWALPIGQDSFPQKETRRENIVEIVEAFAKTIQLQTTLTINRAML